MKFEIGKVEQDKLDEWMRTHECRFTEDIFAAGAIGGRLSYTFTPTGLGVCFSVKCACGAEEDFTDIDNW